MATCEFLTVELVEEWCNLPNDILAKILSYLFGKDYTNFLSVCRSWRSTSPPLRPIPKPCSYTTSEASRYPSLFNFSGNDSKCKLYDPFYNGSYVSQIPSELIDARIYFSNYGWLLMSQGFQLFFFHPFTNQRIDLPSASPRKFSDQYSRMCFSSPPTSPDCMVFGIFDLFPTRVDISIIRRGEASRRYFLYETENENASFYSSRCSPVFYKGGFYCLSIDGKLGVFDPKKRGRRCWKIIDNLKHPCKSIQGNFLVESDGELLSICMGPMGEYVRIFRLNFDYVIRWEEVRGLGDKMIFACRTGCVSIQTNTMGNTIYFPCFDNGDNGLFYSLASRKFHSLGLGLARKDLNNSRQLLHCAWMTPTASEIYTGDELRWFPNHEDFIPSSRRVMLKTVPRAHLEDSNHQLFFNMFDSPNNFEKRMHGVGQMRTITRAFGWLFQVDRDYSDCLLVNPQTMEKIHLPQLTGKFNLCAISSSPNDPGCIVLLIHSYNSEDDDEEENDTIDFIYCRPGESEWTILTVPEGVESSSDESEENSTDSGSDDEEEEGEEEVDQERLVTGSITYIIGYGGKIYGLSGASTLVEICFDPIFKVKYVKRDVWDKVVLPRASTLGTVGFKIYMVEACGDILVVRINYHGEGITDTLDIADASKIFDVEVFKLDIARKVWEKVGSMCENIAFFCYDNCYCISSSAMEKGKGNSIYFIRCFHGDENIYAFDFEDGSICVRLALPEVNMD